MGDQLSNRQLAFATWLYNSRPILERLARIIVGAVSIALLAALIIMGALFFTSYTTHRLNTLASTQSFVISSDPSLSFSPSPLIITQAALVKKSVRSADMYGSIRNPNAAWVAEYIRYYFTSGGQAMSEPRETFAIPGENAVFGFVKDVAVPTEVSIIVEDVRWRRIILPIERERLELFSIESRDVRLIKNELYAPDAVSGMLVNKSPFGFWSVPLVVLIYNGNALVGVGEHTLEKFSALSERSVDVGVGKIVSPITDIQIIPRVNILDERSLML
ncbi:MAG: hypothetical protein HY564_00975 [Candidatus Jacksonbacteria bacterium]|nr:hypothetical protein [Candidatus Jacksonbacteria bacterium]